MSYPGEIMSTKDDVSAFLAKGGAIARTPTGQGNSLKIGFNPNLDHDDVSAMKMYDQSNFVLSTRDREPKPKRHGRK